MDEPGSESIPHRTADPGLRELKKERTRRALMRAAYQLFAEKGYDKTTTTEIARAAEVSPGTFFNYFATKEDLLFGDRSNIITAGLEAIAARHPTDRPADALLRAFAAMLTATRTDPGDEFEQHRARLVLTVPSVYATMLQRTFTRQEQLATALHNAYPDELDEFTATTIVGAFTGAAIAAARLALNTDTSLTDAIRNSITLVANNFR
ncbi:MULTISPECIES: TetR/AcrR family transcriptional regulator [unclassified Nocardia]|uniref:TetR/AcrR family transcriptional regulator n=1 Tax=unclassified Nocardia TaxID=2637762 RepID=UPI001CE41FB4|nr:MULTISPECIES: TetR/AcrR family transcriptional regulator [unclassified Nocardia]